MATVEERVISATAKIVKVDPSTIKSDTKFVDDMGLDSMDIVDLIIEMEGEFGDNEEPIEISDEDAEKFICIKDVVDYLKSKGVSD